MGRTPLPELLGAFFDGHFYFSDGPLADPAEVGSAICPPEFPKGSFAEELAPILDEASQAHRLVRKPLSIGHLECDVRISVSPEAVLATCSSVRPRQVQSEENQPLDCLSEREFEVLSLLTSGLSNKQVAAKLFLSHRTVEKHRARIHQKTGTRSLAILTRLWIYAGYDTASCGMPPGLPAPSKQLAPAN